MTSLDLKDIHSVRVHPGIGFARVGNSPDGYFTGPEIPGAAPAPDGGLFKDGEGRVKRQAARFRCYGFNEAGDQWVELTHRAGVSVEWTVNLVNKKACAQGFGSEAYRNKKREPEKPHDEAGRKALTIAPGPMRISGPGQRGPSAVGEITLEGVKERVALGELRTDEEGRLLVLGGDGRSGSPLHRPLDSPFDNDGWWDSTSDGPVDAVVRIDCAGESREFRAVRAWAVVTPPKYAPHLDTVVTLWDRLEDLFRPPTDDEVPSYTFDIQPVLARARHMQAVFEAAAGHHISWPEPLYGYYARRKIDSWLSKDGNPDGSMPRLAAGDGDSKLTRRQLAVLQKWRDGNFLRDWRAGAPRAVTPGGLDRAALEACVGKAFFPGIEAGAFFLEPGHWSGGDIASLRFAHTVEPGDVTSRMALPWQADFHACGSEWWPVPRPNEAIPKGQSGYKDWAREWAGDAGAMADNWHRLGFVVPDEAGQYRETERGDWTESTRLPPPEGQWSTLAAAAATTAAWQPADRLTGQDLALYGRGELTADTEHTWRFRLTEEDRAIEITVRAPVPQDLDVRLASPLGPLADDDPRRTGIRYDDALVLRVALPVEALPQRYAGAGLWSLSVSAPRGGAMAYQVAVAVDSRVHLGGAAATRAPDGALTVTTGLDERPPREAALVTAEGDELPLAEGGAPGAYTLAGGDGQPAAGAREPGAHTAAGGAGPLRLRVTGSSRLGHPYARDRFLAVGDGR
ncbi:LodA/GoxA family CTQ-dependent oxidase [Streptomyces sp. NPDC050617]|uniref:LodA/GoxA family CTQ-dependent oxidase n=1 Tax=Streptomyces sp. NPDC050617 TaxID=3154628 RepID=UPI003443F993